MTRQAEEIEFNACGDGVKYMINRITQAHLRVYICVDANKSSNVPPEAQVTTVLKVILPVSVLLGFRLIIL